MRKLICIWMMLGLPIAAMAESEAIIPTILNESMSLAMWQWIGLAMLVVLGVVADKTVTWFANRFFKHWQGRNENYQSLEGNLFRPLGLLAMAIVWMIGLKLLALPEGVNNILMVAVKLFISLAAVWTAFRMVTVLNAVLTQKAADTPHKFDDLMVPMVSKSLKLFVAIVGFIFIAKNLNVDVTSLLAGLGIGGLAFALAAKDLLGNFFGSLTVVLDRPFHIGDWVVIGDVEGSVEEVGFRSSRIRTFYDSVITLPNALLTTSKIDNMGARHYRRMTTTLGLTYDTSPEKIDAFCEGIRTLIQMHPYMRKDSYHVYFNEYSAASLDVLVYVFWQTPDWGTELRERHRFLLDILRLAKQLGVEFAYPTQTIHLKQDSGAPEARGDFATAMTEEEAFTLGQREAEAIIDGTIGRAIKPEPVRFP